MAERRNDHEQMDIKKLSRTISLVENEAHGYEEILQNLKPSASVIIGITGAPGAGKSSLVDGLIEEFGEGIESGETFPLPMLERSEFSVSGSGADFVHVELDAKRVPPRLLLTPRSTGESSDLTFQVTFHYSFGDEVLTFCIVPTGTPITDHSKESPLGPTFEG